MTASNMRLAAIALGIIFAIWSVDRFAPTFQSSVGDRGSGLVVATQFMGKAEIADVQSYTGSLDVTRAVQRVIDTNPGRTIVFPAGRYKLTSRINVPTGVCITGEGWAELPAEQVKQGTIIVQDYAATQDRFGFFVTGSGACIRNLEIRQSQSKPHPGWRPNQGPWAIYAHADRYADTGGHRLSVEHVMLRNVFDGIRLEDVRGGFLKDVYGQPLHWGIYISGNGDEPHLSDIHLGWTYWSGDKSVLAWQKENATGYLFGRVDNPQGNNLFAFGQKVGFRFFYDRSHGDAAYDGVTSAGAFVNIDADNCVTCVAVEDNPETSFVNLFVSPDLSHENSSCLASYGVVNPGADYGNLRLTITNSTCRGATGPAFKFAFSPPGKPLYPQYIKLLSVHVGRAGTTAVHLPVIYAVKDVIVYAPDLTVDGTTDLKAILQGGGTFAPPRTAPSADRAASNGANNRETLPVDGGPFEGPWEAYKPVVTCAEGKATASSLSPTGYYKRIGNTVAVTIRIGVPSNYAGTCRFPETTLPFAPDMSTKQLFPVRENASGTLWSGTVGADGKIKLSKYDGTGQVLPSTEFSIEGVYWSR